MKTYMPLDGFRWSCDSDSALCDIPQTNVLGQAGGGFFFTFYKYFNYLGIDWMITMQKLSHYYHATATLLLCYGNTVIVLRQHGCSATAT